MARIKGYDRHRQVQIGDKRLTVQNVEDVCSYRVFIVDDVYELGPRETVYECTRYDFKYRGKITQFVN